MTTIILDCSGREGIQHQEASEAIERSGDPCWGWIHTHTYDLGDVYRITKMHVKLKAGPSELETDLPIYIEYSLDGRTWDVLKTVYAPASRARPPAEYDITCDITARYIRFRSRYYVDGSYAVLEAERVGGGVGGFKWALVILLALAFVLGAVMMVRSRG